MSFARVALIGFGEVGQILAEDLAAARVPDIAAWDILFPKVASAPARAAAAGKVRIASSAADAVAGAELTISAVTAAADVVAATAAAAAIAPGGFFLDLNSASPDSKRQTAEVIHAAGGRYVEAAVMTPFPPKRIASTMLLGGPHAVDFLGAAADLGLNARVYSDQVGQASAVKMCRSVMVKGVEALLMESMLTARRHGVEADVLASLSDLLPVGDWPALARYMISRSLEHGTRRAEEMREAAQTVLEASVEPLMSQAIARRQDWAAAHERALAAGDLGAMLDAINADIDRSRRGAA